MCGICGIVYDDPIERVDQMRLVEMRDRMIHRGPDDAGIYLHRNVGLGHRRLSIIDRAGGHQPLSNEDQTIWIIFNGEIYNHLELRKVSSREGASIQDSEQHEVGAYTTFTKSLGMVVLSI